MRISSQSSPSPIYGAGVTKARLQQIHQIHQGPGSDEERLAMLKFMQEQIAGKQLQRVAHVLRVNASTEQSQIEIINEHGDTLIISDAARQLYEKAADSSSKGSSGSISASNTPAE